MKRPAVDPEARAYFEDFFSLPPGGRAQRAVGCPFHADHKASFSLNLESGLWKCHAQADCGAGNLAKFKARYKGDGREAGDVVGREPAPARAPKVAPRGGPEAEYLYRDTAGRPLFKKVRWPEKKFFQERYDGDRWLLGLEGVAARPLYNLPAVIAARNVAFCEGEKDADRLNALFKKARAKDWAATTNFDGATGPWREEYSAPLRGKRVVILPDNDAPGRAHAELFARETDAVAASVAVAEMPGLAEKGDVSDWLDRHGAASLRPLLEGADAWAEPGLDRFKTLR